MKILGRNHALILGYGLYRNHTENPWFRIRDINDALPVDNKPIPPSSFTVARNEMKQNSLVETSSGEENLVEGMLYVVRNKGLTVPGMLEIPIAIEAFLEHTDFEERLLRIVTGTGRIATSLPE